MNILIPKPNGKYEEKPGQFLAASLNSISLGGFSREAVTAFERRMGLGLPENDAAALRLVIDKSFSAEGYRLCVDESGIVVRAGSELGVIWALTSLFSLKKDSAFPFVTIEDAPRYGHRGFMLDCSRHFFPAAVVKEIIEQNSLVKLNVFHWHLSDDQGWRIESDSFPKLMAEGEPYFTKDEIREVVAFAKERGVEVIPEIDMPGHTLAISCAYPELCCKGEAPNPAYVGGIYETILCAGREETYTFIKTLLDEISPLFESEYFHIGGDEVPKTEWESCPHCQAKLQSLGYSDFEDLQGYFNCEVSAHLKKLGKIPMGWNDVLKSSVRPENIVIQHWSEMSAYDNTRPFLASGGSIIMSDVFSLYFDYDEYFTCLRKVYEFEPCIKGDCLADHAGLMGIQACLWTERVIEPQTLYGRAYPRTFALAEAAWTKERSYEDFEKRLETKLESLTQKGIGFIPIARSNPDADERLTGIMEFLMLFSAASEEGRAPTLDPEMVKEYLAGFGIEIPQ